MSEETLNISEAAEESAAAPAASSSLDGGPDGGLNRGRRTEKIGIVTSDKMTKTIVVRVDRLVKHPVYKRYVRKRSKFMAHNEIEGVTAGDQVRIVETRPLSAQKRWAIVAILGRNESLAEVVPA